MKAILYCNKYAQCKHPYLIKFEEYPFNGVTQYDVSWCPNEEHKDADYIETLNGKIVAICEIENIEKVELESYLIHLKNIKPKRLWFKELYLYKSYMVADREMFKKAPRKMSVVYNVFCEGYVFIPCCPYELTDILNGISPTLCRKDILKVLKKEMIENE